MAELAGVTLKNSERASGQRWATWFVVVIFIVLAVDRSVTGSVLQAAASWLVVCGLVWIFIRQPRRLAHHAACAVHAQLRAHDLMAGGDRP